MSIIMTALALTAGAQAAPAASAPADPQARHAEHQKMAQKQEGKECACCKEMAGGKAMACCEQHQKGQGGGHAGHPAQ